MNSTARIVALQLLASRHVGAPCLAAGNAEDNAKPAAAATGDIDFTSASSCRRASTGLMSSSMAIWEQWSVKACRMSSRASSFSSCISSEAYVLTCCMPLANSACAVMLFIAGFNFARRTEQLPESKPHNH